MRDILQQCPIAMKSRQALLHQSGRVQVKNLVQKEREIQFATWNVGTLIGKSMELCDTIKRKVNIACLQETKRKGD